MTKNTIPQDLTISQGMSSVWPSTQHSDVYDSTGGRQCHDPPAVAMTAHGGMDRRESAAGGPAVQPPVPFNCAHFVLSSVQFCGCGALMRGGKGERGVEGE